jgi:hypothetical protein
MFGRGLSTEDIAVFLDLSVIASSYSLVDKPWKLPSPEHLLLPPHPFVMAILISFLLGSSLGGLAWWFTKRHLQKKMPNSPSVQPSLSPTANQQINMIAQTPENAIDPRNNSH